MPRSETSAAGRVVAFFRATELPIAELVLGMCQDAVRERKQKSAAAKARATAAAPIAAGGSASRVKKGKTKTGKRRGRKLAAEALPLEESGAETQPDQEAEDLVVT